LTAELSDRMMRTYVSPLVRFVSQSIDFTQGEVYKLTKYARVSLKKAGKIPYKISNGRVHSPMSVGGFGVPYFMEEDYLEALAVRRYLLTKEFMEGCPEKALEWYGKLAYHYTEVGVKRVKLREAYLY